MPLIFGQFMLYFGQDKINSIIRSFALASWPCQHHISERASAAARSAASASEHSCNVRVCTYVDTMYISNLYMYQKSFEVPTMWSRARRRKHLFGTSGHARASFREVWEINIAFCPQSTFCRQICSCFEHCFVT